VTRRTRGPVARTATGLLTFATYLLLTGCVAQGVLEDGEEPGEEIGVLEGWLVFGGIPLLILVLTAIPIFASARKKSRYRPSQGWDHQPLWFAGPADPEAAVSSAPTEQPGRGGASASW
jgi:hypothetical protein